MASSAGGMEIEDVAAKNPGAILKETLDPGAGLPAYQARKLAFGIGIPPASVNAAVAVMLALYRAYIDMDASLAEINPFVLTKDGKVYALDAKINFDDNALYRHKELLELRDLNEEDPLEVEASQVRPQLHQAGRHRGLHGERRGPRHGHHGHHQVRRRQPGQLSRRGRRRQRRTGRRTRFASCSPTPT